MIVYRNPHAQNYALAQQQREALVAEQRQITDRLSWITRRIAELDAYLMATAAVIENDPSQALATAGLAQVCRIALENASTWMTAQQLRDWLLQTGIDISEYTNPMAVLHTTLKRVGEVYRDGQGNTYYAKKGTPHPQSPWVV